MGAARTFHSFFRNLPKTLVSRMGNQGTDLLLEMGTNFTSLAAQLVDFLSGSEGIFLKAGARLHGLEQQAYSLLDVCKQAVTAGEGDLQNELTRKLEGGVKLLEAHKDAKRATRDEGKAVLKTVVDGIGQVVKLRDGFKIITSTLRSLASSTQIENTRMGLRGIGFDTVARDVREMATLISPKFEEVLREGQRVQQTAELALAGIKEFASAQGRESSRIRNDAYASLDAVDKLTGMSKRIAQETLTHAEACHRNIGMVQVSLQVHDITRQMIEHVEQGLRDFSVDARAALRTGELAVEDWMAEVLEVCRLEGAQLHGARTKLVAGIAEIERNLNAIANSVEGLATEVGNLGGAGEGNSLVDRVESGIRKMAGDLREHVEHEERIITSLGAVVEAVNTMEDRVYEVSAIGGGAKIIGLNAMVKASNAGRDGLTLTVLARAVQEVAESIETISANALSIMGRVGDEAHRLVSRKRDQGLDGGTDAETIIANLDGMLSQLRGYHDGLSQGLSALSRGSAELKKEVADISVSLATMRERSQILETLEKGLAAIASRAQTSAGPPSRKPKPVREASHHRRYTMAAERATLDRMGKGGSSQDSMESTEEGLAEGSVEFF